MIICPPTSPMSTKLDLQLDLFTLHLSRAKEGVQYFIKPRWVSTGTAAIHPPYNKTY